MSWREGGYHSTRSRVWRVGTKAMSPLSDHNQSHFFPPTRPLHCILASRNPHNRRQGMFASHIDTIVHTCHLIPILKDDLETALDPDTVLDMYSHFYLNDFV